MNRDYERLVCRLKRSAAKGRGVRLSAEEVLFLLTGKRPEEPTHPTAQNEEAERLVPDPAVLQIRWLIRRDMPAVLEIEQRSFSLGQAWSEEEFLAALRQRNCIGMVAEQESRILGYMVYELNRSCLQLLNLAVAPEFRRQGVGRQMIYRLADKLSAQRRSEVALFVRESNVDGQLFFRSQGFRAVETARDIYSDTNEDGYLMKYRIHPENVSYALD